MRKEQMQIVAILIMSMSLLVSDGLVRKIAREKSIFMRKMGMNLVGHCPMYLNPFRIRELLELPLLNQMSKMIQKGIPIPSLKRI